VLISLTTRWFDVTLVSKRDRAEQSDDDSPQMFYSNTASSQEQTYHETDAPTLGYRSRLKENPHGRC
jgi:hypothetical protein